MNFIQKLLKAIYPVRMQISKATGLGKNISHNQYMKTPPVSFYSLQCLLNNGKPFSFEMLRGKYVLLVNTASNCGFTGQYEELEKLFLDQHEKLAILGFPANDFGGQEPGSDSEIASFCKINFGVTFPLAEKAAVTGKEQQPVYQWLTNPSQNGWNDKQPAWNFCKYLVDPQGNLLQFYSSAVSPLGTEIMDNLNNPVSFPTE